MLDFVISWPISSNQYYSRNNWTSVKGRVWRDRTLGEIWSQTGGRKPEPLIGPVKIVYEIWLPNDRRRRDIRNHTGKHLDDLLTKAGVWEDDSQIWECVERRCGKNGKGKVHITIEEI